MESHRRSIVKAISYRIWATITTIGVALAVTGHLKIAIGIGLTDTLIKVGIYYCHERLWNRVPYGKKHPVEYQI